MAATRALRLPQQRQPRPTGAAHQPGLVIAEGGLAARAVARQQQLEGGVEQRAEHRPKLGRARRIPSNRTTQPSSRTFANAH
jgi:hypothetical protein